MTLRIHKKYPYLLATELPENVRIDLAYHTFPNSKFSKSTLLMDYDLSKLNSLPADKRTCGELADIESQFHRILIQVNQYDALHQVKRDILAAGCRLLAEGELRVALKPKTNARIVEMTVNACFDSVQVIKTKGAYLFICRDPIQTVLLPENSVISYFDPVSLKTLKLYVRPGMFSSGQVDKGTHLLLQSVNINEGSSLLDVGCGCGVIGITTAARGADVSLLDVDARAVKLTQENLQMNGYRGNVHLKQQPYDFPDASFDIVLSNPPTHSGSETLQLLFSEMVRICGMGGYVAIVVREHLNYEKWLVKLGEVSLLAVSDGYKIIQIEKHGA